MRQVIPFSKDIVFKTNIANITSISLEHEEKIMEGEVSGDFIIFGDYKIHNDTTEKELFKYRLPFTALIPDNIERDSVIIDIENFTYEQIENDVLKVNIDFSIEGEEKEEEVVERNVLENEDVTEIEVLNEDEVVENKIDNIDEIYEAIDNFIAARDKDEENDRIKQEEVNTLDNNQIIEQEEVKDEVKEETSNLDEREKEFIQNDIENVEGEITTMEKVDTQEMSEYVTYHIHIIKEEETLDGIIKNYGSNMDVVKCYNDVTNIKVGDKIIIPEYLDE